MVSSLIQTVGSLILVLGAIFALGWITRRLQRMRGTNSDAMQIENGLQVGAKERVLMIKAGGQHFLVGVTASNVSLIHRFHGEPDAKHNHAEIIPFADHLRLPH